MLGSLGGLLALWVHCRYVMQGECAHGPTPRTLRRDSSEYETLKLAAVLRQKLFSSRSKLACFRWCERPNAVVALRVPAIYILPLRVRPGFDDPTPENNEPRNLVVTAYHRDESRDVWAAACPEDHNTILTAPLTPKGTL
ncbi:hypothetical protein K491DRAFT_420922 [Lophiostoma macrostomum CBS 122681]|uniref:Secreted protein n=1 Tax=Lophiostoma macrostomum CBS 122681 TaxID=1314788 RepID=A0A6A6TPB6_9PLEO|nr:hypothetical protein K491DRAFT_420922 [Lophiostoma macrostomum CBS 122681]